MRADIQAVVSNVPDQPISPGVLAEHSTGWMGLPGLLGHRGGRSWSTLFEVVDRDVPTPTPTAPSESSSTPVTTRPG